MFGDRLKIALENKDISQSQLAKQLGFTSAAVNRWCQNITEPDAKMLVSIANFLEVSTDFLLGNDNILKKYDKELLEKLSLKNALIGAGFMQENEDLTNAQLKRLMKFIKNNKEFIKFDE